MRYHFCVYTPYHHRVDIYLSALFWDEYSRSYIQKMMERWFIFVNGKQITKFVKVHPKDEIIIEIEILKKDIVPQDLGLDIIFEDYNIIIINKDSQTNTHPVPWEFWKTWTLVNAVLHHCKEKLPVISWEERPWIVHRLDKDTTGLIMIAKNDKMMEYLQTLIRHRKVDKYYIAIVKWIVESKEFRIESYIWRDPKENLKMTTKNPINPKLALTLWKVLGYIENKYTVVEIKLETGRTHQIRVHLSSIGYPIIGDSVYGDKKINEEVQKKYWLTRQALHAYRLQFELYWEKREFIAPLKEDMKQIIWNYCNQQIL
jgi:23S rRNA pseudouridine1911/1915/1917 synthase